MTVLKDGVFGAVGIRHAFERQQAIVAADSDQRIVQFDHRVG